MQFVKRSLAFLLSVLLLVSLCGCSLFETLFPDYNTSKLESAFNPVVDYRSQTVPFEQMKYSRPDIEKMRDKAAEIEELLDGFSSRKEVVAGLDEFFDMYNSFNSMLTLSLIRSDLDTNDDYYLEENAFCSEAAGDVDRIFDDLMLACSNSSMCRFLDSQYFGGLLEEQYSSTDDGYTPSDELVKLYRREAELENDYNELYVEFNLNFDDSSYKKYYKDMGKIYVELIKVRNKIAELRNTDSYEELAYLMYGRHYNSSDLGEYTRAIKKHLVPLYNEAYNKGLYDDMDRDIGAMDSEKAFTTLTSTVRGLDERIDTALDFMLQYNLYDVTDSDSKYNHSYVAYIDDYAAPFLYTCPSGYSDDVLTIAHEFGHYVDGYTNYNSNCSLDSEEMFSQGMEYLTLCNMKQGSTADTLTQFKMLDALNLYIDQASFNEFEQRAYALSDKELTVEKLNSLYEEIAEKYGFRDEYDDEAGMLWISIPHLFTSPFYVISYCVSDSAAFKLYNMELDRKGSGLSMYMKLIDGAADYEFLELLSAESMDSPITEESVKEIADTLSANLNL